MKNIEGNKKIIAGVVGFIIIITGAILLNNHSDELDTNLDNQAQSINTSIPFDESKSIFSDKEDAYRKEMTDKERKDKEDKEGKSNFGSINTEGVKGSKLTPEEKVDSLLKANKITDADDTPKEKKNNKRKKNNGGYSGNTYNPGSRNNNYSSSSDNTKKEAWNSTKEKSNMNGFFSSNPNDKSISGGKYDAVIYAVIYGDKNTPEGGRVSLRLTNDATINGIRYKRNTLFYSFAKFGTNRVFLKVEKINQDYVSLDVYDSQDGMKGIYTEENLLSETASETADDVSLKGVPVEKIGKKILNVTKKNKKAMLFNGYKIFLKKSKK